MSTATITTAPAPVAAAPVLQQITARDVEYCAHKGTGENGDYQHHGIMGAFNAWVADGTHTMTVLLDDGLYRHLRFAKPHTGSYRFDLITWPGYLTISGDIGCYTFSRVSDMFDFFEGHINSSYWAEKMQHGSTGGRAGVMKHDEDLFKAWLVQDFWEGSRDMDHEETRLWWEALRDNALDPYVGANMGTHEACWNLLQDLDRNDDVPDEQYEGAWESSWDRYEWQFEFCLAAIVTGIRTYKAHKAGAAL